MGSGPQGVELTLNEEDQRTCGDSDRKARGKGVRQKYGCQKRQYDRGNNKVFDGRDGDLDQSIDDYKRKHAGYDVGGYKTVLTEMVQNKSTTRPEHSGDVAGAGGELGQDVLYSLHHFT